MSYIYLIKSELPNSQPMFKIGYSKNPEFRLANLKIANPSKMSVLAKFKTKHNRLLETTLHNNHKNKNINGEWFYLSPTDVDNFIKSCAIMEDQFDILTKANNPFLR